MPRAPKPWYRKDRKAWYAWIGGRQIRLSEDYKEAVAIFHRLMLDASRPTARVDLTVPVLCDLFAGHVKRTLAPTTFAWYVGHLERWAGHCNARKADSIRPKDLTAWLAKHADWSPSTRRGAITAVKRAWAWAVAEGHLAANHLAHYKRPPMGRRAVMSPDDVPTLIAAIRPNSALSDLVTGLLETGCRPGELAGITAADVAPGGDRAIVRGKTGERTVYLSSRAADLLAQLAIKHPEGPLFRNSRGHAWDRNAMRCAFRRLRRKTGIEGATAYALRHLYATLAIERGVDPLTLAELMGHRDVTMLREFYVRHREDQMRRAAEQAAHPAGPSDVPNASPKAEPDPP